MTAEEAGKPIVIVGGGLTGGNAAATLRTEGFGGRVVLVGREPGVPFGRPPLSKTYLRSEEELDGWYVEPAAWYEQHDIERIGHASVATVDASAHSVALDDGSELGYDKLLIATGGRNRRLRAPGDELDGIHYLRTVAESDAIKHEARAGRHAAVVGMGFIGCEVAASLTQLGVHVTALFPGRAPLERVLGSELGAVFGTLHERHGVELRRDESVVEFRGAGRVEAVVTNAGERIACDFAVVGVGIEPQVPDFVGDAVPEESNGILVDERCRTSVADVYGAGDVANAMHPIFGRVRVEHYNNAEKHGRFAARSMLGSEAPYDYIHSFWSDQYDQHLEYVGHSTAWDQFVVRGSIEELAMLGFYLREGRLEAAVGLGRGGDPEADPECEMAACARLVAQRAQPDPAALEDDAVDLWSLPV